MKKTVVAVVGPTAVGKTSLGIEIAKRFNGEVISGDSMQIYKGMNIGTAKVTEEEKQEIPHHMIDIKEPTESFSVAEFQKLIECHVSSISERGNLPIIVGGTGLYIQAALFGYNFAEKKRDDTYQKKIEQEIEERGIDVVFQRLRDVDPERASKIHPNNQRRVVRALEVYERTGMTMSASHNAQQEESEFNPILIGLEMNRQELYDRINKRVDLMIESGLLDEVKHFYDLGLKDEQSMKAIGYKELVPYFDGKESLEACIELLKRNSRRYAKRQYTWFKNRMDVNWYPISVTEKEEIFQIILNDLAGKLEKK